ncbi:MAG: helicase, partial [Prevotella sp.]|nr:helicase [Prevotella sp.]
MNQSSPILQLQRQRMLLEIEYYFEKEAFRKQTETMGLQRKVKRGDAWFPVKVGKSYYNSLNQLAVEVYRTTDQDIEHNFEFGRPVCFFKVKEDGKTIQYYSFTATVSYVDGDRMVVTVPDNTHVIDLQDAKQLGLQLFFDETSYRTMFEALDRVMKAKNNRLAHLRDLFYSSQ